MKHPLPLVLLGLLAAMGPVAAQDYSGDILPQSTINLNTSLGTTSTATSGSVDAEVTVNAQTSSLTFDQIVANNVQLSNLVTTEYITTSFTTTDKITTTLQFNPISFSLVASTHPSTTLTPGVGSVNPFYNLSNYLAMGGSLTFDLSGSYTLQGSSSTASGTFSIALPAASFIAYLGADGYTTLQTGNYPDSLTVSGYDSVYLYISASQTTTLFSQTIDGSTIAPTFSGLQLYSTNSVTLSEAPEPSILAYLVAATAVLLLWHRRPVARQLTC